VAETFDQITERLADFIAKQHVFFVATAPLAPDGLVNLSPKGLDTLRILDPRTVAYLDLTGSGIETVSHLYENGRICVMFCAFDGAARIVRLHGTGTVLEPGEPGFEELYPLFPARPHARSIVKVDVTRVGTSCGYAVPLLDYRSDRDVLDRYWESDARDPVAYRSERNRESLDGLPALRRETIVGPG
jgi:hypothetical protein